MTLMILMNTSQSSFGKTELDVVGQNWDKDMS